MVNNAIWVIWHEWTIKKSVVITLGCTGTITGFDIDTTGFMDASPSNVLVEGYVENQREEGKVRHAEMRTI